jgi:hypothetical protein
MLLSALVLFHNCSILPSFPRFAHRTMSKSLYAVLALVAAVLLAYVFSSQYCQAVQCRASPRDMLTVARLVCVLLAPAPLPSPLLHAAYKGDLALVQRLLPLSPTGDASSKPDVAFIEHVKREANARDAWNNTALHWAARGGSARSVDIARHLLAAGANVDARNNGGSSALHWASSVASADISRALISLLLSPSADVGVGGASSGIYVSTINHAGETPLHWAVDWLRPHAVEALIDAGADVNKVDVDGNAPLHKIKADCERFGVRRSQRSLYVAARCARFQLHAHCEAAGGRWQ